MLKLVTMHSPFQLVDVFDPQVPNFGAFPRYSVPNAQNNPFLKPETTTEIEFGVDARFFNNRLGSRPCLLYKKYKRSDLLCTFFFSNRLYI